MLVQGDSRIVKLEVKVKIQTKYVKVAGVDIIERPQRRPGARKVTRPGHGRCSSQMRSGHH